jgi:hypothetical protein
MAQETPQAPASNASEPPITNQIRPCHAGTGNRALVVAASSSGAQRKGRAIHQNSGRGGRSHSTSSVKSTLTGLGCDLCLEASHPLLEPMTHTVCTPFGRPLPIAQLPIDRLRPNSNSLNPSHAGLVHPTSSLTNSTHPNSSHTISGHRPYLSRHVSIPLSQATRVNPSQLTPPKFNPPQLEPRYLRPPRFKPCRFSTAPFKRRCHQATVPKVTTVQAMPFQVAPSKSTPSQAMLSQARTPICRTPPLVTSRPFS